VTLIVYYLIFMIAGDFAAYFLFLWVSWVLAMWVTKPRVATQSAS